MSPRLSVKSRASRLLRSAEPHIIMSICFVFVLVLSIGAFALLDDLLHKSLPLAGGLIILMGLILVGCVYVIQTDIVAQGYKDD